MSLYNTICQIYNHTFQKLTLSKLQVCPTIAPYPTVLRYLIMPTLKDMSKSTLKKLHHLTMMNPFQKKLYRNNLNSQKKTESSSSEAYTLAMICPMLNALLILTMPISKKFLTIIYNGPNKLQSTVLNSFNIYQKVNILNIFGLAALILVYQLNKLSVSNQENYSFIEM